MTRALDFGNGRIWGLDPMRPALGRPITPSEMFVNEAPTPASRSEIPACPPAEALAEVARAAKRVDELHALGRSIHFEFDAESGRVMAELHYLETGGACEIPLRSVLAVISGDVLPV